MTLSAGTVPELKAKWAKAHTDAHVPVPHGRLELREGVFGTFQVIWRGVVTTALIDGVPAQDPRTVR